jgi:hypothetical protein
MITTKNLLRVLPLLLMLCGACPAVSAPNVGGASNNIAAGLQSLTLRSRAGLESADASFASALTNDPQNPTALVLKTASGLALLQQNPEFVQLLTTMGVTQPNQSIFGFNYTFPTNGYGTSVISGNLTNVISYIDTTLLPQLSNSISNISRVATNISFTLTDQQTGTFPVAVDYGDVQLSLCLLHLSEVAAYLGNSYNLNILLNDLLSGELTTQEILSAYPRLFEFSSNDRRNQAKQAFINANAAFQRAASFVRDHRVNQPGFQNVFSIDNNDPADVAGMDAMARRFDALATSFTKPQIFPADSVSPSILDGKFINLAKWVTTTNSPRSWLGTNSFWGDLYNAGTLTDNTLSGILPDTTEADWSSFFYGIDRLHLFVPGAGLETNGGYLKAQTSWMPLFTEGDIIAGTYATTSSGACGYGFLFDGTNYTALEYPMAQYTSIDGMAGGKVWGTYAKGSIDASYIYSNGGFRDIRYPGAESTYISELEDGGVVIGWYWNETQHSFIYDGTSYRDITFPGANNTWIRGRSGNYVWGSYSDSNWQQHGFLLVGTTYMSIDYPSAYSTYVKGIFGTKVFGDYWGVSGSGSFLYENGNFMTISYPGANSSWTANQGDNGNFIAGTYNDSKGSHGYLFDGTTYTSIDYPGATATWIDGSSGNKVWGNFYRANKVGLFVYENGQFTTINIPGGNNNSAWISAISGNNVFGSYWNGSEQKAFVFNGSTFSTISYPGANSTYLNEVGSKWVTGNYSGNGDWGSFAYPLTSIVPDPVASPIAIGGNTGISSYTNTASNGIVTSGPVSMSGNATIVYTNPSATIQSTGAVSISGTNNLISLPGGYRNGSTNVLLSGTSFTAYYGSTIAVTGPAVGNGTLSIGQSYTNPATILTLQTNATSVYLTVEQNTSPLSQGLVATPTNVPVIYEHGWTGWIGPNENR